MARLEGSVPSAIRRYFAAHDRGDADAALATFAEGATVLDDGEEYVGSDRVRHWLAHASTEFTYTRSLVAAQSTAPPRG
jgi:ketosteroid isomerase-like protein